VAYAVELKSPGLGRYGSGEKIRVTSMRATIRTKEKTIAKIPRRSFLIIFDTSRLFSVSMDAHQVFCMEILSEWKAGNGEKVKLPPINIPWH
jgi:hypothetical protein